MHWTDIDRFVCWDAERQGGPLPEISPGPRLLAAKALVERQFGVQVVLRPHTFRSVAPGRSRKDERVVFAYARPDFPEEETMRILIHEGPGHLPQDGRSDRTDIGGYVACERDADERAYAWAQAHGFGDLFPPTIRQESSGYLDAVEEVLYALAEVAGTDNALLLKPLLHSLRCLVDPLVGPSLRACAEAQGHAGPLTLDMLEQIALWQPELIVGYDRKVLRHCTCITTWGPPAEPLALEDPERAHGWLADLMCWVNGKPFDGSSRWGSAGWNGPRLVRYGEEEPQQQIVVAWWDMRNQSNVGPFLNLAQALVTMDAFSEVGLGLTWTVAQSGGLAFYGLTAEWPEARGEPEWRALLTFDRRRPRDQRQEEAVRAYVNSFRDFAAIVRREAGEFVTELGWLLRHSVGPAPAEILELLKAIR